MKSLNILKFLNKYFLTCSSCLFIDLLLKAKPLDLLFFPLQEVFYTIYTEEQYIALFFTVVKSYTVFHSDSWQSCL